MRITNVQRGSVIVEVLVASLIFATALLALVAFESNLLQSRTAVDQQSEALSLIQNQMQYFRSYTSISSTSITNTYNNITSGSTNTVGATATYSIAWTVVTTAASTNVPANKNVTITATWTGPTTNIATGNNTYTASINSIIAEINPDATGKISQGLP